MTLFDPVDQAIIVRLQYDGRTPYESIAEDLGVDVEEIRRRAEAMSADGVFSVVAVTDPLQLGFPRQALLGLEIDGPIEPVAEAVHAMDEVIYLVRITERIDLLAEVVGTSDARLLEIVARIRQLPGVRRIHTALLNEVVKETYAYGVG